jgi:hypothetical protein
MPRKRRTPRNSKLTQKSQARCSQWVAGTFVFLSALLVFANNWDNEFVFDDGPIIVSNARIRSLDIRTIFGSNYWGDFGNVGLYRPLTMLSYALNYQATQLSCRSYHIFNDVLHALNSVLVFLMVAFLFESPLAALSAGLLFGLHPIHTEAVTWVVGRAELMAAFFVLIAILMALLPSRLEARVHPWRTAAVLLTSFLGILSKENAIVAVPAVAGLLLLTSSGRTFKERLVPFFRVQQRLVAGWAVMLAAWLILRHGAVGKSRVVIDPVDNQLIAATLPDRLWTALSVFTLWLRKMAWPLPFSVDYGPPKLPTLHSPWHLEVAVAAVALLTLMGLSIFLWRHHGRIAFWLAFFVLAYLPTSNLFLTIGTLFGERLLYLPSAAFCVLAGWALSQLPKRWLSLSLLILICVGSAVVIWGRNHDWQSNATLFAHEFQHRPASARALRNYAKTLEESKPREAIQIYEGVLHDFPSYVSCRMGLGTLLLSLGENRRAIEQLSEALRLRPENPTALLNLGAAYAGLRNWEAAAHFWEETLRQDPANQAARANLEQMRKALGRTAGPAHDPP